jgi:hypothetical protein
MVLRRRAGPFLQRMEQGFLKDAFHYLLVLRLVPLFPFWLVNLVPAFFGMSLRSYALATLIGIAPASIVFASLGSGLGSLLDAGQTPDLGILFHSAVAPADPGAGIAGPDAGGLPAPVALGNAAEGPRQCLSTSRRIFALSAPARPGCRSLPEPRRWAPARF